MVKDYLDPPPPPAGYFNTFRQAKPQSQARQHSAAWLDDATRADICEGDAQAMMQAIARLAAAWLKSAGVSPDLYRHVTYSEVAGCHSKRLCSPPDATQRAFLAAGCDLMTLLALAPQGRQALHDLGFEPVAHHAKSKG